ncbi:pyrroline-5-carboxylate reductase [Hydrogenothermus marinus]|uniref:Pyrroline-5-carboxylate reductase n=1 Tax=Hydrogenothermus marinus TaxID=133270 RepID=A0A3M0BSN3_9AQUI|nr:pyrroline-5-carboxylate reductase [Hydrogenothermus marinus]RMA97525.1 pyrroline-5-carboxylate reductase [Hydrogenothermus marinus]
MQIGIIGVGNMGEAILKGLISVVNPENIYVSDINQERLNYIEKKYKVKSLKNEELVKNSDIIFLVVKPKDFENTANQIKVISDNKIIISSIAGLKIEKIKNILNKSYIVRIMPNTPASVKESATGISFENNFPEEKKEIVINLINSFGKGFVISEDLMDAFTGLSGSGPAYILTIVDALAQAGVKQGFSYNQALNIVIQTLKGTAILLEETKEHPASLRDKITSPAGTTIYGLHALEKGKIRDTLINCVEEATKRSKELS